VTVRIVRVVPPVTLLWRCGNFISSVSSGRLLLM